MSKPKKEKKVDIFHLFSRMNSSDFDYVMNLSDEDLQSVSVYVLLMWVNGVDRDQAAHLILTNAYVNHYVFHLQKHNRLLLLLMFVANGDMGSPRYQFTKAVSKQETKSIRAVANYYDCSYSNAKGYIDILSKEEVKEMEEIYDHTVGSKK